MNWIDFSIFLFIIIFAVIGSKIGIFTTISGIVSGLISAVASNLLYLKVSSYFPETPSTNVISYIAVFIIFFVVIFYLAMFITNILSSKWMNSFLGALLGIILGAIVGGMVIIILVLTPSLKNKNYVRKSTLASFVVEKIVAPAVKPFSKKSYEALTKDIIGDVKKNVKSLNFSPKK
ncbi:MAG: hypothetical protein A2474_02885 [Elusimicrobia bacterium RIFOXYC2_FULL_34_12]|nr:MAG: hypothetical protein A2474_02885 [Elusimicrobia bacterium RIFOXYC2_FULL_34_12]OGS39641.1 MAG: hypothetical protein A2551_03650 [Elusimicrobia bacterium RIFOXYD2_FULL_34_30]HAM37786.1 hypothetical protein [Elusimicrobiota bacterium]